MSMDKPPFRLTRARRRVLLVLLSGAGGLSGFPICRVAQAGSGTVYVVLANLERLGWVIAARQLDGRRFYALTPEGRTAVLGLLGLAEQTVITGTSNH